MNSILGIPYFMIGFIASVAIVLLFTRYFLITSLRPKLFAFDTFDFLSANDCIYIDLKILNKNEIAENHFARKKSFSIRNFLSTVSEYKVIAYSEKENKYKLFWVEITRWLYFPFFIELVLNEKVEGSVALLFIEEKDSKLLSELEKNYSINTVLVREDCPACGSRLSENTSSCLSCGLIIN